MLQSFPAARGAEMLIVRNVDSERPGFYPVVHNGLTKPGVAVEQVQGLASDENFRANDDAVGGAFFSDATILHIALENIEIIHHGSGGGANHCWHKR
jgi:hypothetical protein